MRILLVYPGQVCSTYDVALGYHEILVKLGHQVHPYNLHDWIEYHQGALNYWATVNPRFDLDKDEIKDTWQRLASSLLIANALEYEPDVILIIHGLMLHPQVYRLLNKLDVAKVGILTECPYIDAEQKTMLDAAQFDHIFVNDRLSLSEFGEQVSYLPHSYSRIRHRPGRADPAYVTDVYFHGTMFDERVKLFGGLNFNGHVARIGGADWQHDKLDIVPNSELVKYYRSTKIALNHHRCTTRIDSDEKISGQSLGPRAYEIAACGAFQLCDDTRPELYEVFGDTVPTYHGADDLMGKIDYYLAHEGERRDMARAALERVGPCSFYNRALDIVLPALEAL